MACLINKRVVNPRYKKIAPDTHYKLYNDIDGQYPKKDYYINIDCGRCINCFKKRMSQWRFRLIAEFMSMSKEQVSRSYFVTLTIEPKYYTDKKPLLTKMVRRFLERVRKKYKKSIKHFLITERGEDRGRYHFHGFLFDTDVPPNDFYNLWYYGFVSVYPVNGQKYNLSQQISYCTTYITKGKKGKLPDIFTPEDVPLVLVSPGIGKGYLTSSRSRVHHQADGLLYPMAFDLEGHRVSLPRYLRQKVFDENELKLLKDDYFNNYSEDVLPEGPYFIGQRQFNDYSIYLKEIKKYQLKYKQIYVK